MRTIQLQRWLLVLLAALLQVSIFPVAGPLPLWRAAMAWFALVPLLAALLLPDGSGPKLRIRDAALLGYVCGLIWYLGTCYWVYSTMHRYGHLPAAMAALAMILFCLYLGLYHALFAALLAWVRDLAPAGRTAALLISPFLWVAVELARARVTSFPWNLLGYSAIDNSLLTTLAPFGGVYLLSFVLMVANALIAFWWIFPSSKIKGQVLISGFLFALVLECGGLLHLAQPVVQQGSYTAVMLQPNLNVGEELSGPQPDTLSEAMRLTLTSQKRTVTLWPESPAPYFTNDPVLLQAWMLLASKTDAPLIAGSAGVENTFKGTRYYNSAALIDPNFGYTGRYDKIHLVPFGEFVPFESVFSFASGLTQQVGNMKRGTARTVFHSGGHVYGTYLCYESIFGDEVRQFVANGAQVLINLSDDGWYGDTSAPFQHLNMARMRAIENHRWLLRDTNSGVTASIDPYGRILDQIPRHATTAATVHFDFSDVQTIYTRYGDWFAYLCLAIVLIMSGWFYICKIRK